MKPQLTEAIARRNMHRIKKVGKPPIWVYPRQYEVLYRAFLVSLVNRLRQHVLDTLEKVPTIIAQRDAEAHTDAWPDGLQSLLSILRHQFEQETEENKVKARLLDIGQKTSEWNDKQWQNTLLKVLGVDVYRPEQFLGSHIKSFVNENAGLITKLTEETFGNVSQVLTRGIRSGDRVNTIRNALLTETDLGPGVFRKVETRARLIARDQIGKLNGDLTRIRQESIGVTQYKWHTALDERVRGNPAGLYPNADPSHFDREGEVFDWDKPPEGGHPGEAIQCRCWAEAIFPEEVTSEEEETTTEKEVPPTEEEEATTPTEENEEVVPKSALMTEEELQAIEDKIKAEFEAKEAEAPTVDKTQPIDIIAAQHEAQNFLDFSKQFTYESEMKESPAFDNFVKAASAWHDSLTSEQRMAVRRFTGDWYEQMNSLTRGEEVKDILPQGIKTLRKDIDVLDNTLKNQSIPQDVVVYRGTGIDHLTIDPLMLEGRVYQTPMFQSTSLRHSRAQTFERMSGAKRKMMLEIRVRKGTKGIGYVDNISANEGELEATLARNAKVFIESITRDYQDHWYAKGFLMP